MKRLFFYFFFALTLLASNTLLAQEKGKTETVHDGRSSLTITVSGTSVRIQNAPFGSVMEVYDILGVKVTTVRVDSSDKTVTLNLPKGYYIFKIGDLVRKVVIK